MKELYVFDSKNYEQHWQRVKREAIRAIIIKDDKLMMVKSGNAGYYKFPGGGMHFGETHEETLIREVLEETGLEVIPVSITEYGLVREVRKGLYEDEIFEQTSYYYLAEVGSAVHKLKLDDYEQDLQYQLVVVTPHEAYEANMTLGRNYISSFILREAFILKQIIDCKKIES